MAEATSGEDSHSCQSRPLTFLQMRTSLGEALSCRAIARTSADSVVGVSLVAPMLHGLTHILVRVCVEGLPAAWTAEVIGLAHMLRLQLGPSLVHIHAAYWILHHGYSPFLVIGLARSSVEDDVSEQPGQG